MAQMKKNVTTIKGLFITAQALIFLAAGILIVVFVCVQYVRQSSSVWMEQIDKTAQWTAFHVRAKNEIIESEEGGNYLVYVINQKDGSYVFNPPQRSLEDQSLWDQYSKKLVYEMQKQKQGWILYPEKNALRGDMQQKVIRYVPLDEFGWIVALETFRPGIFSTLSQVLDAKFYIFFACVMGLGIFLLVFLTEKNFEVIRKLIADSIESSLLTLNNEEFFHSTAPISKAGMAPKSEEKQSSDINALGLDPREETYVKENPKENPKSPFVNKQSEAEATSSFSSVINKSERPNFKNPELPSEKLKKDEERESLDSALQGVTINIQHIKSSVLKKMITDFRNNK